MEHDYFLSSFNFQLIINHLLHKTAEFIYFKKLINSSAGCGITTYNTMVFWQWRPSIQAKTNICWTTKFSNSL